MSGRLVYLGLALTVLAPVAGAGVAACYTVPTPDCGFRCGPAGECPDGYTCADEHRCHRIGAPADLVCDVVDAAVPADTAPGDAMVDGAPDAALRLRDQLGLDR